MSRLAIAFIEKVWRESIGVKNKEVKEEKVKKKEEEDDKEIELSCKEDENLYFMMEV